MFGKCKQTAELGKNYLIKTPVISKSLVNLLKQKRDWLFFTMDLYLTSFELLCKYNI